MKLFGYYVWHNFVNQLKKLIKTWVLILLLICFLFGTLIGFGVGMIGEAPSESEEEYYEEMLPGESYGEEVEPSFAETFGIEPVEMVELAAGAIILFMFVTQIMGAEKNGGKIFLPADVALLFASPLKPQSVLLFRVMTQLGTSLLISFYLLLQVPNLVHNYDLTPGAALSVIAAWFFALAVSLLLKIYFYILSSTRVELKSLLRKGIYALGIFVLGGYILTWKLGGGTPLSAAAKLFNNPITRWIPLWGWIKGFCMYALEGNVVMTITFLVLVLMGGVALIYVIWHMKVDFYEDAMAKSEEMAVLLAQAQSEKGGVILTKRKKDRSEKLKRDGMRHGAGANVFFYKAMYNRFRFAHFGVLTKTAETYLMAAAGVSLLCRLVFETDGLIPVALTLAGFSFFRALGNPLSQDTQMDFFRMIPESSWKKLFWSLMGGTANCFLDLLPAMLVSVILLGASPLEMFAWIPLIVTVDFFATTVGAFIDLSVPVSAGKMVKQIVQIMFIYFGLLPDIAIMVLGLVYDALLPAAIGCSVLNILLGLIFFFLTPLFLEPKEGKKYIEKKEFCGDLKLAKKHFSRLGLGVFMIMTVGSVLQVLMVYLFDAVWPSWAEHPWGIWIGTFVPIYLIAVPLGILVLRKVPSVPLARRSVGIKNSFVTTIICFFMMYGGNILGLLVMTLLASIIGTSVTNPVLSYATAEAFLPKVLFIVILAPLIEEYIFRKQLIDRMHVYGEKRAVFLSALIFGLFHGNLFQFFYAFALGLVFGFVYLKTGRMRYTVALHILINFIGSVVSTAFLEHLDLAALDAGTFSFKDPWFLAYLCYLLFLLVCFFAGMVLLCINIRKIHFAEAKLELPKGLRLGTVYGNAGMILMLLACAVTIVLSMVAI